MRSLHPLAVLLLGCLAGVTPQLRGADLQVSGSWYRQIGPADLVAGAGSDFASPLYADQNPSSLGVSNTGGEGWTVSARLITSALPSGVSIGVRADSANGVACGTEYLTLSSFEQTLCTGIGDRSGIGLALRLHGVSNAQPSGGYGATVQYRVY
ncbi:hypothetical protein [Thiocapsa bogorovii]|uniref:hypothetical protein n=1 Tax=Thiocapsa bogorovii TaxID=521689 RepID=UPI001E485E53|nr:hypothetical protein [Thiocapsa bogorovii]UHD14940.1 hypothetical protein LT988_16860 [Thiocapsa bogorovii]